MKPLLSAVLLFSASLSATTIAIKSDLANEGNNITGTNVLITPDPNWEPNHTFAKWVSFANTGWGGMVVPDVPDPITGGGANPPTASFYELFSIAATEQTKVGTLDVWADDTTRVTLINLDTMVSTLLFEANPLQSTHCAAGPIGCVPGDNGHFSAIVPAGLSGNYKLVFDTYQRAAFTFGVLYDGSIETITRTTTTTPEPTSMLLTGLGLVGAALLPRLRRTRGQS